MVRIYIVLFVIAMLTLGCSKGDDAAKTAPPAAVTTATGVAILAPADRSIIKADTVSVSYEVKPSPSGDHIHIYVDDRKPDVLRKLKGSYDVTSLNPGAHTVVVREVNAGHTPTGHDATIHFTVEQ